MKLKRKLDGGLKIIFFIFLFFFIISKNIQSSQILDYETEEFIYEILKKITKVNKVNKNIKFKINSDDEINAFVDHQNIIHVNSGLIQYSHDYVALLSVLAHEVGHIDLNHISLRKENIKKNKKYRNLSLLSVIAGSAATQRPEFLQSTIISSAALSNQYIDFTKEQEIEADLYALNTLELLNTNSESIVSLLKIIEQKLLERGFTKNQQRISTHPYLEDRILFIENYRVNKNNNYNINFNNRFNFIKAKFIGYSNNIDAINNLDDPFRQYAKSIRYAKKGNLKLSLENLNKLIKKNSENNFLLETKADILFSYGFTDEAIKFYRKNLENYPLNFYAQIRIFENINIKNLSDFEIEEIFNDNKPLLFKYFNNKNILHKYLQLANRLNKTDWVNFLNYIFKFDQFDKKNINIEFSLFKKTKDKDLLKLIKKVELIIL
tara:strand:- start:3656 stop:4963 length:1308 start_codon:yes stop_codon:yes gene_type:complete